MVLTLNKLHKNYKSKKLGNKRLYSSTTFTEEEVLRLRATIIAKVFKIYDIPIEAPKDIIMQYYCDWTTNCMEFLEDLKAIDPEKIYFYVEAYCVMRVKTAWFKCYMLELKALKTSPPFSLKTLKDFDELLNKQQNIILKNIYLKYKISYASNITYVSRASGFIIPLEFFEDINSHLKLILYSFEDLVEFEKHADMFCSVLVKLLKIIDNNPI